VHGVLATTTFFRWVKQTLKIHRFPGTPDPNTARPE
jgi:hypothetical protein